ncbi:MAG: carbon-nitrogen hydrolase family protein [Sphaerobacteraceae bacterium]|nr:MAG: carbon-nitrogen hydrolase family protein [Sphaerobacteraceae bacterium]
MRVGLCQINSRDDKAANIDRALELVDEAAERGARLVALPEYVDYLGPKSRKYDISEPIPGPTSQRFAERARQHGIYLLGGSYNETSDVPGKCYNTSLLFDPSGEIIATYRKVHLFDSQISGNESDYILPGNEVMTVEIDGHTFGIAIAYDYRFPEMFRMLALAGAEAILVPSNNTVTTGKDYWHVMLRGRAVENHLFILAPAQVGPHEPDTIAYGHSLVVHPTGTCLVDAPEKECVVLTDIDFDDVQTARNRIPSLANRRPDVYSGLHS